MSISAAVTLVWVSFSSPGLGHHSVGQPGMAAPADAASAPAPSMSQQLFVVQQQLISALDAIDGSLQARTSLAQQVQLAQDELAKVRHECQFEEQRLAALQEEGLLVVDTARQAAATRVRDLERQMRHLTILPEQPEHLGLLRPFAQSASKHAGACYLS